MYYRNAQSALVVYDLTKPTSMAKAKHWVAELQRQASPGIVIALVGNKVDLCNEGGSGGGAGAGDGGDGSGVADDDDDDDDDDDEDPSGDARKVSTTEAKTYAEEEGLLFFETSAKTGANVSEVFTAIANAIPESSLKGARGAGAGQAGLGGRGAADQGRVNLTRTGDAAGAKEGCAC